MSFHLYNTLTKKEEEFFPRHPPQVTMYTCGPTVYGRPHIGNYSSFLMADLLRRWLEVGHRYTVLHAKNITDVGHLLHDGDHGDDKIQKEAEKEKVHPLEVAQRYTEEYLEDERLLHILEPAYRPRATAFIEQMKTMTETLLTSGHAYVTGDGIYFDVTSKILTSYGTLSGNTLDAVRAGARVSIKEEKRHPSDFALWKFCIEENANHVLRWASPKGPDGESHPDGFPGWHIECSAMSRSLLGDQIDIHTGGEDNIFPHHECEIAQSECVTGKKPFVYLWLHKRRIDIGGAKMSKSLGNMLTIPNILERGYDPMDLRYYLLSVHYRTHLKFTWKGMDDARKAREKIVEWMEEMQNAAVRGPASALTRHRDKALSIRNPSVEAYTDRFQEAMDADLNTPAALAAVFDCMAWSRKSLLSANEQESLRNFCVMFGKTFGCFEPSKEGVLSADIEKLVREREQARSSKDFPESDRLRGLIEKRGYEVRDTPKGQVVRRR